MSRYLIKTTEIYRADTEAEAKQIINEASADGRFILQHSSSDKKEKKQKGEIIDEWYRVGLVKIFDDEKEPNGYTTIEYNTGESAF